MDGRSFVIRSCDQCGFAFVENPRQDFERLYDERYYRGEGADSLVNYAYESEAASRTIRTYEWSGIHRVYAHLAKPGCKWMDFGCGNGEAVRWAREQGTEAWGYETGWAARLGRAKDIPILDEQALDVHKAEFGFVTAIEVMEHVADPIHELRRIRRLLKRGGILFLTTGNAEPWRRNLLAWGYTKCPDVHIAFFEPRTMGYCLQKAGFRPCQMELTDGLIEIIKYKVLKNLRVRDRNCAIDLLPWRQIAKLVDARYQVSAMPYGVAI